MTRASTGMGGGQPSAGGDVGSEEVKGTGTICGNSLERGINFLNTWLLTLLYPSRSIVTQAGSKIDSSKFYYCEKSEDLHSCSLICWLYHGKSSKA